MTRVENIDNYYSFIYSDKHGAVRLDQYILAELNKIILGAFSRTQIADSIRAENCKVNNKVITKPSIKLNNGDEVSILIKPAKSNLIPDSSVEFEILYEDESILVISKPAGLIVHPAPGVRESTLVHGLYSHLANSLSPELLEEPDRLGVVHRLDKDTSGIMVVAKSMKAKRNLQEQLIPPRTMKRIYHAIVFGRFKNKRGGNQVFNEHSMLSEVELVAPISRHPINRTKYKVEFGKSNFKSRQASTIFRILKSNEDFHLLECELMTGRTHQIRVHLEYLGVLILGDKVYGPSVRSDLLAMYPFILKLGGQQLHARTLEFLHPETHSKISLSAKYPENFNSALLNLGLC